MLSPQLCDMYGKISGPIEDLHLSYGLLQDISPSKADSRHLLVCPFAAINYDKSVL
jgi:hypothetical protein